MSETHFQSKKTSFRLILASPTKKPRESSGLARRSSGSPSRGPAFASQLVENPCFESCPKISLRSPQESSSMTDVSIKFTGPSSAVTIALPRPGVFSSTKPKTNPKPSLVMKPIIPFALLGALLAVGAADAAATTPVGYETLAIASGYNYLGVRLHEPVVVAGVLDTVTSSAITDAEVNFGTVLTGGAGVTYVVEFDNGSGVIQEVTGASGSGSTLTLTNDITSAVSAGATYQIRKASTLASIFGAANEAGLTPGFSGSAGADIVSLPDGAGGFGQYYYDEDNASWSDALSSLPVVASEVPIVYADGVVLFANAAESIVVTGEVKTFETLHVALPNFNYFSSVYPAGATLSSAFDGAIGSLNQGFSGSSGADVVYVPDGLGGFGQFYYDGDNVSWSDAITALPVNAATINLPSGVIVFNAGTVKSLVNQEPSFYSTL